MKDREKALAKAIDVCICPKCQSEQVKVYDMRHTTNGCRRKRKCLACGYRYSTMEVLITEYNNSIMQMAEDKKSIDKYEQEMKMIKRLVGIMDEL